MPGSLVQVVFEAQELFDLWVFYWFILAPPIILMRLPQQIFELDYLYGFNSQTKMWRDLFALVGWFSIFFAISAKTEAKGTLNKFPEKRKFAKSRFFAVFEWLTFWRRRLDRWETLWQNTGPFLRKALQMTEKKRASACKCVCECVLVCVCVCVCERERQQRSIGFFFESKSASSR